MSTHKPKSPTFAQVVEGAERAHQRVAAWPDWKRKFSSPATHQARFARALALSHSKIPLTPEGLEHVRELFFGLVPDAQTRVYAPIFSQPESDSYQVIASASCDTAEHWLVLSPLLMRNVFVLSCPTIGAA